MKTLITLLGLTLLLGACQAASTAAPSTSTSTSAPSVASPSSAPATAPADATAVKVLDFKILPAEVKVAPTFSLFVTNDGPTVHNVTIRDQSGKLLMGTRDLRQGESAVLAGSLPAGTYITFCSLPGHESLGTKGTLVVGP